MIVLEYVAGIAVVLGLFWLFRAYAVACGKL